MTRSSGASSAPERAAPAVALVGPTAAGKTDVGLLLAEALDAPVIGCDSRQVYRRLDIGTAKPTPEQRRRVRHHLVDVADPGERFSAARYRDAVLALLPALRAAGRVALLVGGTGLYLRAALEGLCAAPSADADLRRWLGSLDAAVPGGLHRLLQRIDPPAAGRIHPNDRYRATRALEVYFLAGETLSSRQGRHRASAGGVPTLRFGIDLPAAELRRRIRSRLDAMVAAGFVGEVSRLLAEGWDTSLPAFRAVGYPQFIAHARGETTLQRAVELSAHATWQYARRQLVWFRADPGVTWIADAAARGPDSIAEEILGHVRRAGTGA